MPQSNTETHIAAPTDITHGAPAPAGDSAGHNLFQDAYDFVSSFAQGAQAAERGMVAAAGTGVLEIPPIDTIAKDTDAKNPAAKDTPSKYENPLTDALSFAGGLTSGVIAGGLTGSLLAEIGLAGAAVALGPEILVGATVAAAVGLGLKAYGDMCASELEKSTPRVRALVEKDTAEYQDSLKSQ